uniref:Uncharacterized protein n=1 Tax=Sphaerodactylus townsendi TaxID=933632 RepID=A0ACB8E9C4_9SAUR
MKGVPLVKELETQLAKQQRPEELCKLQAALSVATEKQACLEKQLLQAEERNSALEEREMGSRSTDDCKAKAVEEMMARIKNGVVLRSTRVNAEASAKGQTAEAANKRRSTVMELQTLLVRITPA